MNFDLDDEQILFKQMVDRMLDAQAAATVRDAADEWRAWHELGLLALPFPADLGGLGGDAEAVMLLMESYGRTLAQAPYLQTVLLAGRMLARAGHAALAGILDGELRAALCLHEPGMRYHWDMPTTKAERIDGGWRLRGAKIAVLDADTADLLIVPAETPGGLTLFAVPVTTPGVSLRVRPTPDGRRAVDVDLDVTLPPDAALGDAAVLA